MKREIRPMYVAALFVVGILFLLATLNVGVATESVKKYISKEFTFEDAVDEIQNGYVSDEITGKSEFIDINGLFTRMIGKRVHNNTVLGKNGMLL